MKGFFQVLFLAAIVALSGPAASVVADDRYVQRLQSIIEQAMAEQDMPGFAVAIVRDGRIDYAAGFGVRSLADKADQITPRSIFHMASNAKPFVATAVMQLVERGQINLDTSIVRYLPYFRMRDERAASITVRQMLTHRSGMPDIRDYEWDRPQYDDGALERYVRSLGDKTLVEAPGTGFLYSNIAYDVLGDLVAKVSRMSFEDYVHHNIFEPLGMTSTSFLVREADPALLTRPHVWGANYDVAESPVFPYNRMHAPSSTLYSNVLDMARWAMANLNRGELEGKRILSAATFDVLWTPADPGADYYGLGWFLNRRSGSVYHPGGDLGFVSDLVLLPREKVAVVAMSNFNRGPIGYLTNVAFDIVLGRAAKPPVVPPPVGRHLYRTIAKDGIDVAVKEYSNLKGTQPNGYTFGERELNMLGQILLAEKKTQDAIAIFQLNAKLHPQSVRFWSGSGDASVHTSLGEAYMVAGDKALAAESFERSLRLYPNDDVAAALLARVKAR